MKKKKKGTERKVKETVVYEVPEVEKKVTSFKGRLGYVSRVEKQLVFERETAERDATEIPKLTWVGFFLFRRRPV